MTQRTRALTTLPLLFGVCLPAACLPADSRPPPAQVLVIAQPSAATTDAFTTADGWTVTIERFLTALGNVDLDGVRDGNIGGGEGECNGYSGTNYEWLFDFAVAEPSKVAVVYGLGTCRVEYRFRGPSDDAVLGAGATSADAAFMRTRATDAFATDERASLVVRGTAVRAGEEKRFDWVFRRSYEIERCGEEGAEVNVLELEGRAIRELRLEVRAEELFRRVAADDGALEFDWFAVADENADGAVTLEELDLIEAPADATVPEVDEDGEVTPPPETLADLLYDFSLPRVTRVLGGGPCRVDDR